MLNSLLDEAQRILMPIALAAFTGFIIYAFDVLRTWLGIEKSEANEEAIRRAAETEAGVLIQLNALDDPIKLTEAATKIIHDLSKQVKAEEYDKNDIKDMILGAAGLVFPPAKIIGSLLK